MTSDLYGIRLPPFFGRPRTRAEVHGWLTWAVAMIVEHEFFYNVVACPRWEPCIPCTVLR